jgi:hypothetical protein
MYRRHARHQIKPATAKGWIGLESLEDRRLLSVSVPPASGLTFQEKPGVQFTADLGTFTTLAPGANLKATINWGDGTTSAGTIKADGVAGLDEIIFEVDGTHTYKTAGTFAITATVIKPGPVPTTIETLVATLNDTAIVSKGNISLNGKITGTYSPAPFSPVLGATYVLNGTGTAGVLGAVSAHGTVFVPEAELSGHAAGTLTLTSLSAASANAGSVTLTLTGPTQVGFGPFSIPSTFTYVITGGTGVYANATGSGTIAVTLGGKSNPTAFTFTLLSGIVSTTLPTTLPTVVSVPPLEK